MKKILIGILVVIILLAISVWIGKDILLGSALKKAIKNSTGLESRATVHLSILKNSVSINDLKLFNPPDYQDKIMMYIPEIFVKCDIGALLKKPICLEEVRLNLNELNVIRNREGKLNIKALKKSPAKQPVKKRTKVPGVKIASLNVKVGKVIYKDYTKTPPDIKEFKINLEEELKDVAGIEEAIEIITQKALLKTAIGKLGEIDVEELKKKATDILTDPQSPEAKETTKKLKDLFKKEWEKIKSD